MEKQPRCREALGANAHIVSPEAGGSTEIMGQTRNASVDMAARPTPVGRRVFRHPNPV